MPTIASTGKPMAAGLTRAIGRIAPFAIRRSTRLRTVGSETSMARAMLAYERRASARKQPHDAAVQVVQLDGAEGRLSGSHHDVALLLRNAHARTATSYGFRRQLQARFSNGRVLFSLR
jgi:hypothetical protein